ncbi:transcription elongation factor B polypeptide 3-like [Quillaja saponaria]|uniref:Transcription elongation factor B polypeptide 3-like n=1 Tax=Quillaja saponaria TaxID=32244 RepID=A0AAD7LV04_QUISA|nr:transcription elongation factor B polypeptide 3-like [Quillaja saponaria]
MPEYGKAPSLVDLCVETAIDNLRYLGDVGETDLHLLERILPHCTLDQLMHVEKCSKGRDLGPVTDILWKNFYREQFGEENTNSVIERMKQRKVSFRWIKLYEAKLKDMAEAEKKAVDRIAQLYQNEDARKQSRQVRICNKVPPSSNRRSFYGSGAGYNVSNVKSNLMKKSKIEFLKSREVKNLAAMKKISIQRKSTGSGSCSTTSSTSSSQYPNPIKRRF